MDTSPTTSIATISNVSVMNNNERNNIDSPFPEEIWRKIINFCDIKTTFSLTKVCRFIYPSAKLLLTRKVYEQRVADNCLYYTVEGYKNFTAPLLENIDPKTKSYIDTYLEDKNINNINKVFCSFIFQQLSNTATKISESTELVSYDFLKNVLYFTENPQSTHCAAVLKETPSLINIYQICFPVQNIKKLYSIFSLERNESIIKMQFTPCNNLLIVTQISNSNCDYKISLLDISLKNYNHCMQTNKLWSYTLSNCYIKPPKITIIPQSEDTQLLICYLNNEIIPLEAQKISEDKRFLVAINENILPCKNKPRNFIFSNNSLEVATIGCHKYENELSIFSRSSLKELFIQKNLPKNYNGTNLSVYNNSLVFNKKGNLCIYISEISRSATILKKIDKEWHLDKYLQDNLFCLGLTYDEQNIFFIRQRVLLHENQLQKITTFKVIPLNNNDLQKESKEDDILEINNSISQHNNIFYPFQQGYKLVSYSITNHPSGLALYLYDTIKERVIIIAPKLLDREN